MSLHTMDEYDIFEMNISVSIKNYNNFNFYPYKNNYL